MRVVLVYPHMDRGDALGPSLATSEHLGLGYLASAARSEGHDVLILNEELAEYDATTTVARTLEFAPDVVGISPVSLSMNRGLAYLGDVARLSPRSRRVIGGHLASLCAQQILENEHHVEFVIEGDGERPFCALLRALSGEGKLEDVPSLSWREDGTIRRAAPSPQVGLDELLPPARDDLAYLVRIQGCRSARILASRGCRFNCSFCTTPGFYGRKSRFRDPGLVIDEMEAIRAAYGADHFWFNDDLFIDGTPDNAAWVTRFASMIEGRGFTFRILCRADSFRGSNGELIEKLVRAGLRMVFLGLESGSQSALKTFRKGTTVQQNLDVVRLLEAHELELQVGFIMFNPYSTLDELAAGADFLREIGQLYRVLPLTRRLSVFPGTAIAQRLVVDGMITGIPYREPEACYSFVDGRIAVLADELSEAYVANVALDHALLTAFRGQDRIPDRAAEAAVNDLNHAEFCAILRGLETAFDALTIRRAIRDWMERLAELLESATLASCP
ncbi:MAG TPA: radical SAM protein [Candidatus Elarobacter sp.]|jgi:radical SAM superfamily enzyme YgiQ (UPF0313 family)|nr:radical SAM protein [Candidatus Elarobacter sp.]